MSKEEAQQQLQDALVKNFLSNLELFKQIDKKLYDRIQLLSSLIDKGQYTERYELEFLEESGEFDIFDNLNQEYIYNKKPEKYNNRAISSVNFDKKGYFSILESSLYKNKIYENDIDVRKLQESEDSNILLLNNIQKYVEILKDDTTSKKKNYKSIDKFIFIGTLLGRHIKNILEKTRSKCYFVHEPNLEIFRLSLFTLDYSLFFENRNTRVFFSVMEDNLTFESRLYNFISLDSWSNHTIKYHTTDYNIKQSFDNVMNAIISFKPTMFNYNLHLHNIFRNMCERVKKYKLLSFPQKEMKNFFGDTPVLYICSGPSLMDNIEWLKSNKDKYIIASIGSSHKKLLEHGIKSDIIITLDSKYEDLDRLQFDKETCKNIQDSIIFASINSDQRIIDRFNQNRLYLYDVLTTLKKDCEPLNGYSVGEVGFRLLLELGVKSLYLLGTDLAINQKEGTTHSASGSSVAQTYDLENIDDNVKKGFFDLRTDLIKVKGNFEKEVYTNRSFNNSITFYNKITEEVKKDYQSVYNLCNHGAYFNRTIPTKIEEISEDNIKIFDKENFIKNIDAISSKNLTSEERVYIDIELEHLDNLLITLENLNNKEYNSYKDFKNDAINFNNDVMTYEVNFGSFFSIILSNYFSIINPYIDYCFNDFKIKNEDKKISNVSKLWIMNIKKLLEEYKFYLKKV